ncbi:MAG TPA: DUF5666 domain-containing protein [Terracidiphilus sp.]|nr:DUF5666 domain-containing protein [Terracidiphilus sp.]
MKLLLLSIALVGFTLGVSTGQALPAPQPQSHRGPSGTPATRGLFGTVTQVGDGLYTIQTRTNGTYTVHFNAATRIFREPVHEPGARHPMRGSGWPDGPWVVTSSGITLGDTVVVHGRVNGPDRTVNALFIVQLIFEHPGQMHEMTASYGKTWLVGQVTAIHGIRVTLRGDPDNTAHTFVVNKHTSLRWRQLPLTLSAFHAGDTARVDGSVKDGVFVAAHVSLLSLSPPAAHTTPQTGRTHPGLTLP